MERSLKELNIKDLSKEIGLSTVFVLIGAVVIGAVGVFTFSPWGEEVNRIIRWFFYLAGGASIFFGLWYIIDSCLSWYRFEYQHWKQDPRRKPSPWTYWSYGMPQEEFREEERIALTSFIRSDTLPTDMSDGDRKTLESAGIVFQEVLSEDPLFQFVVLPKGWSRRSGRGYWDLQLVDGEGCKRATIAYKPTPYDRSAVLRIE